MSEQIVISAGDPKGLELGNANAVYRSGYGHVESKLPGSVRPLIPSVIGRLLWSLGSCTWNAFVGCFVVMDVS